MDVETSGFAEALDSRYRLERLLGAGGTSTVYLATDVRHERPVAIKVLRDELAKAVGADRFVREMRITARLAHPNILPLFDSGEAAGRLWFAMPWVDGESLHERLQRETQLAVEDAIAIAAEVADALDYAHGRGIVHRDIKPANILLTGSHALVADFGIARIFGDADHDPLTSSGVAVGTTLYMSPEQLAGEGAVGPRSDIYALACVLNEMLTGEPPNRGPTIQATLARRLAQSAPSVRDIRPTVPVRIDNAIRRALAPIPADRFASAAAFKNELTAPVDYPIAPSYEEAGGTDPDPQPGLNPILSKLMRHRAFRASAIYVAFATVILSIMDGFANTFDGLIVPMQVGTAVLLLGPPAIGLVWLLKRAFNRRRDARDDSLERLRARVSELEAERDFYRSLADGSDE